MGFVGGERGGGGEREGADGLLNGPSALEPRTMKEGLIALRFDER